MNQSMFQVPCPVLLILLICSLMLLPTQSTKADTSKKISNNGFHFYVAPQPSWVESIALPSLSHDDNNEQEQIYYLLSDSQTLLPKDKTASHFNRIALTPLTSAGLTDSSEIQIQFNPEYQSLTLHEVTIHRDNKLHNKLDAKQIRLIQRERDIEKQMYDGVVTAFIILNDVRVNDIVDYSYTISGTNPVFDNKSSFHYSLAWAVPVGLVNIRMRADSGHRLNIKTHGMNLSAEKSHLNGFDEYRWQLKPSPAIHSDKDLPSWYDPYPWLQISQYASWKEVANWANQLYQYEGKLSEELLEKIKQWKDNDSDTELKIRQALRFVQEEIRYFGVELGENTHRPSHPNDTFSRRFGDCKDKTLLFIAILHELGIEAYPALVSSGTRQGIENELPSPNAFDHVIATFEYQGKRYWLDGTRTQQRGRLEKIGFGYYGKALIVKNGETQLTDVHAPEDYQRSVMVEEEFISEDYSSAVIYQIRTDYFGSKAESQRYHYETNSRREITQSYLNYFEQDFPGISVLTPIKTIDDEENNIFTILEQYSIPNFWRKEDQRVYADFHAYFINSYTRLPDTLKRTMPIAVSHPIEVYQSTALKYPEEVDFDFSEGDYKIETNAISYQRESSYLDKTLRINFFYRSKKDVVDADETKHHIARLRDINDDLYHSYWVSHQKETAPNIFQQNGFDFFKSLLNSLPKPVSNPSPAD